MKIDYLAALGITAVTVFASLVVSVFTYAPGIPLEVGDIANLILGVVILAGATYFYFGQTKVEPSAQTGFYLGCVMVVYTFATGFLSGFIAGMQGYPVPTVAPVAAWVMLASLACGFAVPTVVGWYLKKQ